MILNKFDRLQDISRSNKQIIEEKIMKSLLPTRQKRSRKLNSFDQVFQPGNYSDCAFTQPQLLMTKNSNSSSKPKFRQRCLKTEVSQPLKKWVYKKVNMNGGQQKVKLLTTIRSICKQYEQQKQISQRMCKSIYSVLDMLVKQESTYGKDMQYFFNILKKLIFCDNQSLKQNLWQFGQGEIQPYNYLIMNVIDKRYAQVVSKSNQIDDQISKMSERIVQIDKRYQQKMKMLMIQNTNSAKTMRIEHQSEIFQLNLKISLLKETVEHYERNFRKAGIDIPNNKTNQCSYGITGTKGIKKKKSQRKEQIEEVELLIQ